jgi:hypothetical protein
MAGHGQAMIASHVGLSVCLSRAAMQDGLIARSDDARPGGVHRRNPMGSELPIHDCAGSHLHGVTTSVSPWKLELGNAKSSLLQLSRRVQLLEQVGVIRKHPLGRAFQSHFFFSRGAQKQPGAGPIETCHSPLGRSISFLLSFSRASLAGNLPCPPLTPPHPHRLLGRPLLQIDKLLHRPTATVPGQSLIRSCRVRWSR